MLTRAFTDEDGHSWMVRWSANADARHTVPGERIEIRPPGLWFTCPNLQQRRFLFWPALHDGELETMAETRLRELLARADTPG